MQRIILSFFMIALAVTGLSRPAPGAAAASPPSITVDADGKVTAIPDVARLILEVETQATTAAAAGQENAKQADRMLAGVKPVLGPEDKVRTLGYRLTPVHTCAFRSTCTLARAASNNTSRCPNSLGPSC